MTADPERVERVVAEMETAQSVSEALEQAIATAARAAANPIEMATENAALRSSVQNAYAIIRALVLRSGSAVTIATHELVQPGLRLEVKDHKRGVTITVKEDE